MNNFLAVLPDSSFALDIEVKDWRQAIQKAGALLVESGFTTEDYTNQMIETVEKLGPYIVVSPGFALAHSRPSKAVLETGLSWVRLSTPVKFGNHTNDPVSLIVGLAGQNEMDHVQVMSALARVLSNRESMKKLALAKSPQAIRSILESTQFYGNH